MFIHGNRQHREERVKRTLKNLLSKDNPAMLYDNYFYYKSSKYFPFSEVLFCNLFTHFAKLIFIRGLIYIFMNKALYCAHQRETI